MESGFGEFKFRIQLTTSHAKTDVYLVEIADKPYIVKGPFIQVDVLNQYLLYQREKETYGMPVTKNSIVYLVPDRWNLGVPLGVRNKVDRTKKYPFLVSESLLKTSEYILRTHSSKMWPETIVIDPVLTRLHVSSISKLSPQLSIDFLNILGFRCKYRLSDIALRNLLIHNGRMYSIDEESVKNETDFSLLDELKSSNFRTTQRLLEQYQEQMNPTLLKYLAPLMSKSTSVTVA